MTLKVKVVEWSPVAEDRVKTNTQKYKMSTKQIEAMEQLVEAKAAGLELKALHHKTREVLISTGWAQIKTSKKGDKLAATPEGKKALKAMLKAA